MPLCFEQSPQRKQGFGCVRVSSREIGSKRPASARVVVGRPASVWVGWCCTVTIICVIKQRGVLESRFTYQVLLVKYSDMDSGNKEASKNQTNSQYANYNPWNLFFNSTRKRLDSENSVSSVNSNSSNYQTSKCLQYNYNLNIKIK